MVVRNKVMSQLNNQARYRLTLDIAARLRSDHDADVARFADDVLLKLVTEGCRRAREYGLNRSGDISDFVCLLFVIGWKFDTYPAFAAILQEPLYRPEERLPYLFENASPDDWDAAVEWSHGPSAAAN